MAAHLFKVVGLLEAKHFHLLQPNHNVFLIVLLIKFYEKKCLLTVYLFCYI